MAKLSAYGRTTLVEVERAVTNDAGHEYRDRRRFMSDCRVLCKSAWKDSTGKWRWDTWHVAAKGHVMETDAASWTANKVKNGWTVLQQAMHT